MLRRKSLLAAMIAATCMFTGCTTELEQYVEYGENSYKAELNGVVINISPISVSVGEEVVIELSHKKNKKEKIEIESSSLSYKETFKTPSSVSIKVETEGVHDISFTHTKLGTTMSCEAIIVCK